jgi:hemolysin activation/secretion protein
MAAFIPPPQNIPVIIEYAQPKYGAEPIVVHNHGYQYVVTGDTLLPPALIEKTLASTATPKAAVNDLLKAYQDSGYPLVGIAGRVDGKTVEISVFQGMFSEVQTPKNVAPFFSGLSDRETIGKRELIRKQILAGLYADRSGQQLQVNVSPASNPGGSLLTVAATNKPDYFPLSGTLNFGNYGSRYSSDYVAGANIAANLTHGIQLTGNFLQGLPSLQQDSFGSNYYQNGIGGSIVTPYGIYGFTTNWTHYRLGEVTKPLFPDGNVFSYQINGTQLLYADDATRVTITEAFNRVKYHETVLNDAFTLLDQQYNYLSGGGNINRALTVASLPGNLSAGFTFNLGISSAAGSLVDNEPGVPTSHFKYGNLSLGYQQTLLYGLNADLTGQAQISASTLPSQQQWVLGGLGNLTAWEPGVTAADSGYTARLEVDAPTYTWFKSSASLGAFLEVGASTFRTPFPGTAPWQTLSDAGLTLKLQLPDKFSATAMTALPIQESGFSVAGRSDLTHNRIEAFFVVQKGF